MGEVKHTEIEAACQRIEMVCQTMREGSPYRALLAEATSTIRTAAAELIKTLRFIAEANPEDVPQWELRDKAEGVLADAEGRS